MLVASAGRRGRQAAPRRSVGLEGEPVGGPGARRDGEAPRGRPQRGQGARAAVPAVGRPGRDARAARAQAGRTAAAGQEEDGQRRGQVPEHHRRGPLRGRRLRGRGQEGQGAQGDQQLPPGGPAAHRRLGRPGPVAPGGTTPPVVVPPDADAGHADAHADRDGHGDAPPPRPRPTADRHGHGHRDPGRRGPAGGPPAADPRPSPTRRSRSTTRRASTPGAIAEQRAGILHGRTLAVNGDPLAGVRVRVHDHPELGSTTTGADGEFDLAVNGGAPDHARVHARRPPRGPARRRPDPARLDEPARGRDARRRPRGPDPRSPRRRRLDDGPGDSRRPTRDGTRTSTLLFAPGTTATMRFADGSTQPLPGPWTVRQTEYTSVGPAAMPAELPADLRLHVRGRALDRRGGRGRARTRSSSRRRARRPRRAQLRRELHRRAGRHGRPDRRLRPHERRVGGRHRTVAS